MITRLIFSINILIVVLASACGFTRLEPGYAAVKIDYANGGQRTDIPAGGYINYNPVTERVADYPIGQQSLVMVRKAGEGSVQGDDSVEVRATGIPLHIDTTVFWRIDPQKIADMFVLRPNVPLIGKTVNDGIDGIVVRRLVRGAMQDIGAPYVYTDLYTAKRPEYVVSVTELLKARFAEEYVILDRLQLGEIYLEDAQQKAISDYNVALQQAQTAEQTAQAVRATANGARDAAIAQAQGEAQATRTKADATAYEIAQREAALAAAPHVLDYDVRMAAANHPSMVTGTSTQVQVPLPAAH